jgi:hypothetical protein
MTTTPNLAVDRNRSGRGHASPGAVAPAPSSLPYDVRIAAALARAAAAGIQLRPGFADDDGPVEMEPTVSTSPTDAPPDWAGSRYVRIYATTKTDPKFDGVRDDPLRWATWTWLLMDADDAWPQPARVGRHIDQAALDHLAGVGLVDLRPGDLYLMHGLDAERRSRIAPASEAGKHSVAGAVRDPSSGRWLKRQGPLGTAPTPVGLDAKPRWTGVQLARAGAGAEATAGAEALPPALVFEKEDDPEGPALTWLAAHDATLPPNGGKLHQRLCRLVERHGADRAIATFEELATAGEATEAGQFVLGASNRLDPIPSGRRPKSAGDLLPTVKEAESAFERF